MKKIIYLFLLLSLPVFSQDDILKKEDVNTSKGNGSSSIDVGANLKESTGKVSESFSIAEIACRSVSYPVGLKYDGSNVFKQAQYQNKYLATGILGIGWSMGVPKIIADTKETATRDDDTFYMNGVELVCVKRPFNSIIVNGAQIWEFKSKSQTPYRIRYFEYSGDFVSGIYQKQVLDYWEVTDNQGKIYIYGDTDNTRENVIAWGNWIGNSKLITGGETKHTIAWNLSKLKDQWNNQLDFSYMKTEQRVNTTGLYHTEASYLSQISSQTGEKITLTYSLKNSYEYYEPHAESVEPDAYQERYEKYYLNNIKIFNGTNLVTTNVFEYAIATASGLDNRKRYLTKITKFNAVNQSLPAQQYEYFTSGVFAGALKKSTNAQGGSTNYSYEEKNLFVNDPNNQVNLNGLATVANSRRFANYQSNNYKLELFTHENNLLPVYVTGEVKVGFYIDHYTWGGRAWNKFRTFIPEKIRVLSNSSGIYTLDNAKFIFDDNFFAALCFDRETKKGTLHLFHLKEDGTWSHQSYSNLDTGGSGNKNDADKDPSLLFGNGFVSVANMDGKIYTYVWNNLTWNTKIIDQGSGKYYYEAKNNFIIALNTITGIDMPNMDLQDTQNNYDRYYFHFLDGEKKWMTKSWTDFAASNVGNISEKSCFYASNSIASFVAGNNPEYLLRWDINYNLVVVEDDVLGSHDDLYPFLSSGNNLFTGFRVGDTSRPYIFKSAAISGFSTFVTPTLKMETFQGFGENKILGLRYNGSLNNYSHDIRKFDPNTNSWLASNLIFPSKTFNQHYLQSYAFGSDIFIAGLNIYKENNNTNNYTSLGQVTSYDYTNFAMSGGDYLYATFWSQVPNSSNREGETKYFYIDKISGTLQSQLLSSSWINDNLNRNMFAEQFGGKHPFFTNKNLQGKRLLNYKIGNVLTDIVVTEISTDNGSGKIIKTSYVYNDSNTLSDDASVIYGQVTIKSIGEGTGSNGLIKKYFDTGLIDGTRSGLLIKEEYLDISNRTIKEFKYTYTKSSSIIFNSSNSIALYYLNVWKKANVEERLFFVGSAPLISNTSTSYDQNGNLTFTTKQNSDGKTLSTSITYAENIFPFVKDKNFYGFMYKKINKVDNNVISAEQINWTQNNGKVYINENLSGTSETLMRLNDIIEVVDNYGNVVQTSNGKGLHKSILMGHNYKYPVATIVNVSQSDVISALEISYAGLQGLSGAELKTELIKLYDDADLSLRAMITIDIYDSYGNIVTSIDERKNEINYIYDDFFRIKYITDKLGNIIKHKKYNYKH